MNMGTHGLSGVPTRAPKPGLPNGYLFGLGLANGTDTSHDIDISVGECRDAADEINLVVDTAFTKRIDADWGPGDGNGGIASALTLGNATWYHVHLIKTGNNEVDAGFDTSVTAANLLADFGGSHYRRLGSVLTDASANILAFLQVGDRFYWDTPVNDYSASPTSGTLVTTAVSAPLGVRTVAGLAVWGNNSFGAFFHPTDTTDVTSDITTPITTRYISSSGGISTDSVAIIEAITDTSSQVAFKMQVSSAGTLISTHYYIDRRGRDD